MLWLKTWHTEIKSMWMCNECLCGTNLHRFYLFTPCFKPKHACAVKPEVLISWTLEIDYPRAPCLGADQKTRGLWERDWLPELSFFNRWSRGTKLWERDCSKTHSDNVALQKGTLLRMHKTELYCWTGYYISPFFQKYN